MKAANSDVRANAAMIFFDLFPLVDTEKSKAECEEALQMQFDVLFVSVLFLEFNGDKNYRIRIIELNNLDQTSIVLRY